MKTKEQAIQEAYGEHWEKVKDYVNDNGWCLTRKNIGFVDIAKEIELDFLEIELDFFTTNHYIFRPKSLEGIENNWRWISLGSDKDLPEDGTKCHFIIRGYENNHYMGHYYDGLFWNSHNEAYSWDVVSHYQPIEKPKPPHH